MSCSPFDLRDYLLDELAAPERRQVEKHVHICGGCREELDRLQLTQAALRSVPEEEIPQRIAFVSDKVFEPSPWRRGWQAFWGSAARLGFASAAMLSVSLVVTALANRPVPAPAGPAPVVQANSTTQLEADFDRRLQAAVEKAVAGAEARQAQKTAELLQAVEKKNAFERQAFELEVSQNLEVLRKQYNRMLVAANDYAGSRHGEGQ
jgi:anti-sigma factor RsiW